MARPIPFSLPQEIVDAARKQRESAAMSTITKDIDSTLSQGFSGLQGIARQAAQPLEHFAQSVASGGISVPTLEDLTRSSRFAPSGQADWVKAEQQRASQAVQTITTGTLGVQVPSMDDLTPQAMRRPAQQSTPAAGTALTGPPVASTGASSAPGEIEAYIRSSAARRGIDPDVAVRVAMSEGGVTDPVRQSDVVNPTTGQREPSFGAFQLYMGGGLGNAALQRGIDPRNPAQWRESVDFALDTVASSGWGQWHGAARVGIGPREGVGTYRGPVPDVPVAQQPAPSADGRAPLQGIAQPRGAAGLDVGGITQAYAGQPYVFGGAGGRSDMRPGVATDCSGFVASVWKNQYGLDLPAHTDGAYNALKQQGAPEIAAADAQPGDVVFYMGAGTGGAITHHMGIAAGGGKVLDMSVSGGDGVKLRDIGHGGRFVVIRDPRVNQQPTRTAAPPPPIVPTGVAERTGGVKLPQGQVNALSQRPVPTESEPAPASRPVPFAPTAPPVRDDWRRDQPGISVPTLAQLHPNVSTAFMQANGREPTPDEAAELATLGYGVG